MQVTGHERGFFDSELVFEEVMSSIKKIGNLPENSGAVH